MTNAELIQKIRTEIERLKDEYTDIVIDSHYGAVNANHVVDDLEQLLSFLSTIEKSEKPLQEGLEEEINRLWESFADEMEGPHNLFDIYVRLAHHFAKWGAEHFRDTTKMISGSSEIPNDLEEAAKNYALNTAEDSEQYSARYLGYKDGAKWQKEQMLKEAVEGEVCIPNVWVEKKEGKELVVRAEISKELGFKFGDKVRLVIIKED